MKIVAGFIFVIALLVLSVVGGSFYTVSQNEEAIITRNGAYVYSSQPGLSFKLPWIDTVHRISLVDQKTHFESSPNSTTKMEAYSADQQPAQLAVSVLWRVTSGKARETFVKFNNNIDVINTRLIVPTALEKIKVVFGHYSAANAITKREDLNRDVLAAVRAALVDNPEVTITGVKIEDISFSPEYLKSIEDRMKEEVAVQRQKQALEKEKVNADMALTVAQGKANAVVAQAEADAKATRIRGLAEADAIRARSDAIKDNPSLIALTQAERWNGVLPSTMLPGNSVPMLNLK